MTRKIIAIESDLHSGNRSALLNPNTILERFDSNRNKEKYTPSLTISQEALWELREENLAKLKDLAGGDDIHYLLSGDITHGIKYHADLISTRMADQIDIAVANLEPLVWMDNIKSMSIVVGTGVHNFHDGSSDELIKKRLENINPNKSYNICYHGFLSIDGYKIDVAHHGPFPGSREWLKGNVARYYLQSAMLHQIKLDNVPADLYVRGHYHTPVIETVRLGRYTSNIIIMPSMTMVDDFAQQAAKSPDDVTCGMMCIELLDGKLFQIHQFTRTYDIRTEIYL